MVKTFLKILWWQLFPAQNISLLAVQLYGVRHKLFWLYALTGLKCLFEHAEVSCCSLILLLPNVVSSEGLFRYCTSIGLFQKKNKQREGVEEILFWKPPWNFSFFYFIPENSRESKAPPLEIPQNCVRSLGNSKGKNQDPWKFHIIFSSPPLEIPLLF